MHLCDAFVFWSFLTSSDVVNTGSLHLQLGSDSVSINVDQLSTTAPCKSESSQSPNLIIVAENTL